MTPAPFDDHVLLADLSERVHAARLRAATAVNAEMLRLYWQVGRALLAREADGGGDADELARLGQNLRDMFGGSLTFADSNLRAMRAFAAAWSEADLAGPPVVTLPWGHHLLLLEKVATPAERRRWAVSAVEHGWSQAALGQHLGAAAPVRPPRKRNPPRTNE